MRGIRDKLVSIRVDSELYCDVQKIINKQTAWNRDTFGSIFEQALIDYLNKNQKKKK